MKKGDRVQLHPHFDDWMRGDRYGEIVSITPAKRAMAVLVRPAYARVKLDKSGQTKRFPVDGLDVVSEEVEPDDFASERDQERQYSEYLERQGEAYGRDYPEEF